MRTHTCTYAHTHTRARTCGQIGYERLIHKGAYTKAFPLHDCELNSASGGMRQSLDDNWAAWKNWCVPCNRLEP